MANRAQDFGTITIIVVRVDEEDFSVYYKLNRDPKRRMYRFVPFDRQSLEICADLWEGEEYSIDQHCTEAGTMWVSSRPLKVGDTHKKADLDKYSKQEAELVERTTKNFEKFFNM